MTKEIIQENIEKTKFKKWQDQTKIKVQEATCNALVRIEMLKEDIFNAKF